MERGQESPVVRREKVMVMGRELQVVREELAQQAWEVEEEGYHY